MELNAQKLMEARTTIVTGEIEFKISDRRFLSGRIYSLLLAAVEKYPDMKLSNALEWAKDLDELLCLQEAGFEETNAHQLVESIKETLENAIQRQHNKKGI